MIDIHTVENMANKYFRRIVHLAILIFIQLSLYAQGKTEPFGLVIPVQKLSGSLYHSIVFIDTRVDSTHMGYVKTGAFDTKTNVVMREPFSEQVNRVLHGYTDQTARDGILYLCVRNFFFTELTHTVVNTGSFHFRASLYTPVQSGYCKINEIDSFVFVKAMDATNGLLNGANNVVLGFIKDNLRAKPRDTICYTLAEIRNPDSTEKSKLKLYNTSSFTEGLYSSYKSFSAQIPDNQLTVEEKKNKIKEVRITDNSGNLVEIKPALVYALIYKGIPYISTSFGYYPLTKRNNNFYFTGRAKDETDMGMAMMFGVAGALLSELGTSTYEMKLDHHTGRFIQLREITSGSK
jgi:hypothetical protein